MVKLSALETLLLEGNPLPQRLHPLLSADCDSLQSLLLLLQVRLPTFAFNMVIYVLKECILMSNYLVPGEK